MVIVEEKVQQRVRTGIGRRLLPNLAFLGGEVPLSGVSVEATRCGIDAAYNDVVELLAGVGFFTGQCLLHQLVHCIDREAEREICRRFGGDVMGACLSLIDLSND